MEKKQFAYGSVLKLTRYDTLEDIEYHFSLMRECGMNTVVIWPAAFWWEEKGENYPFDTGKKLLDIAERMGIKVIMELAGQLSVFEYIPDFMMKKEYHPKTKEGHREFGQNSFGFLNYFHPEVNALICEHYRKTALAYKDHTALLGYDVFNETMFRSFDEYTMEEFRVWLREKYGTVERLNEVWERTYSDFSQIEYEDWKWMSIMPEADYNAFRKDCIARFMKNWCAAIRAVDTEHPLIADNIGSMVTPRASYTRPQDDFALKDVVDEIGMSFYPKGSVGVLESVIRQEIFDGFYAASRREGYYISEMQTHLQAIHNFASCVRPHELKRWCMEAYASGAKGLIYWMWRPFDKGLQTMGRGLVDHKGRPTERYEAAREIAAIYAEHGTAVPVRGRAAIVYDALTDDFQHVYTNAYGLDHAFYANSLLGAYRALHEQNCQCDVTTFDELSPYRVVFLTDQVVMDGARAEKLKKYVSEGGIVITDGRFGFVDHEAHLNLDLPGGPVNDMVGTDLYDHDYEGLDFTTDGICVKGFWGRNLVHVTDGEVLGSFADGHAAVTRVRYGKGYLINFNTYLWYGYEKKRDAGVASLAERLVRQLDLNELSVEGKVRVRVSEQKDAYLFSLFNETDEEQQVKVTFRGMTVQQTVAPQDSVVISRAK